MARRTFCALFLIACPAITASQWIDPGFEEMVESAELIVVAEVVEGGKFECTVRSLDVIKGARPDGTFRVGGYNNRRWPPEGIGKESLAGGEKLVLFLRHANEDVHSLSGVGEEAEEEEEEGEEAKTPEGKKEEAKEKPGIWLVPTPTTGD